MLLIYLLQLCILPSPRRLNHLRHLLLMLPCTLLNLPIHFTPLHFHLLSQFSNNLHLLIDQLLAFCKSSSNFSFLAFEELSDSLCTLLHVGFVVSLHIDTDVFLQLLDLLF